MIVENVVSRLFENPQTPSRAGRGVAYSPYPVRPDGRPDVLFGVGEDGAVWVFVTARGDESVGAPGGHVCVCVTPWDAGVSVSYSIGDQECVVGVDPVTHVFSPEVEVSVMGRAKIHIGEEFGS